MESIIVALVPPSIGALSSALIIIIIGIFIEKHYVSIVSVLSNILSLVILLISIDLSPPMIALLVVYFLIGVLIWYKKWNELYFIFGCKTYGSLNLVIMLNSMGYLGWSSYIGRLIHPVLATEIGTVLIGWVFISSIVIILGKILEHYEILPELD